MNFTLSGIEQVCSGALIAPTLVVTAGHCIYDEVGAMGLNYYFTKPGVALDAAVDSSIKQPKILKVFTKPGYLVNAADQKDDIAIIQLDYPLATTGFIRLATTAEILKLTKAQSLSGYGFGYVYETNASYSPYAREYSLNWQIPSISPPTTIQVYSTSATACSGDSGGPITAISETGEEILVAVMSGAAQVVNYCGSPGSDGKYIMKVTVVDTYKALIPTIAPTPVKKITKINCYKGKIKKVVSGVNPKCPKGYVKR